FGVSLTLVAAALYRYDNGVWLGLSALAGVSVLSWRDPRKSLGLVLPLVLSITALSVPALIFIETHGGVRNAADQVLAYAIREADRTRITSLPRLHLGARLAGVNPSPPSANVVLVRWAPAIVPERPRLANARRLGLDE